MAQTSSLRRQLPPWVLPGTVALGVVLLLFFSWKVWTGGNDAVGPPKEVHPGMYDLRKEVAKMRAGKQGAPAPEAGVNR